MGGKIDLPYSKEKESPSEAVVESRRADFGKATCTGNRKEEADMELQSKTALPFMTRRRPHQLRIMKLR